MPLADGELAPDPGPDPDPDDDVDGDKADDDDDDNSETETAATGDPVGDAACKGNPSRLTCGGVVALCDRMVRCKGKGNVLTLRAPLKAPCVLLLLLLLLLDASACGGEEWPPGPGHVLLGPTLDPAPAALALAPPVDADATADPPSGLRGDVLVGP